MSAVLEKETLRVASFSNEYSCALRRFAISVFMLPVKEALSGYRDPKEGLLETATQSWPCMNCSTSKITTDTCETSEETGHCVMTDGAGPSGKQK